MKDYPVYKGLQKPLVYRGFKGKYIAYGISSLGIGLVIGGISGALLNMYIGGAVTIITILAGLSFTLSKQESGLHAKTKARGIFIYKVHLRKGYGKTGI